MITGVIAFGFAYSVLKEPDLGTAFIILGTYFCMLYAAGMKPKHIAAIIAVMAVAGGVFIGLKPGQKQRIYTWKKQGTETTTDGLQTYYGRLGLGSGELLGRGIGSGKEKHFLPQANTDLPKLKPEGRPA